MEITKSNGHSTILRKSPQSDVREAEPNAYAMVNAMRSMGYDPYRAIMDIIDNSIDANADDIRILVDHQDDSSTRNQSRPAPKFNLNSRIIIVDNGNGMDKDTLLQATRFGSETLHDTRTDLGKFGMGLKTATLSFGRKFTVLTRQTNQDLLKAIHDLDEIKRTNKFIVNYTAPKEVDASYFNKAIGSKTASGTIIIVEGLDKIGRQDAKGFAETLRGKTKLGRVYRYFLNSGKKITVNRTEVEPFDPSFWNDPKTTQYCDWTEIVLKVNNQVLKSGSKMKYRVCQHSAGLGYRAGEQGIIWVRNQREICSGIEKDIWRRDPQLAGFTVEIKFLGEQTDDELKIPIPKDRVTLGQSLTDVLVEHLSPWIKQAKKDAKKRRAESRKDGGDLDKSLASYASDVKASEKFLDVPPGFAAGTKSSSQNSNGSSNSNGAGARTGNPLNDRITSRRRGWNYRFEFLAMGEFGPVCDFKIDGGDFVVYANEDHPFVIKQIMGGADPCRNPAQNILMAISLAESQLADGFEDAFVEFKEKFSKNLKSLTDHIL